MNGELAPGAVVQGRFRIEQAIGGGGYGTVYRATQLDADRPVALKVLHPELVRTVEARKRFEREAELARRLRHPNTVFLYDYGSEGDVCFIAYELLRGRSLSSMLDGTTGITGGRVARIAGQVLRALGEAHALGIVHRDVKPSNIFLAEYAGERDYVKLLDFGIAKDLSSTESTRLTQTGQSLGTPHYMAPEQINGRASTPATDVYAVGLVMAEMITGATVYQGTAIQVIAQQLSHDPPPFSRQVQDHPLGPVIARATMKDPAQRYPGISEMLAHLEQIDRASQHAPTPVAPPTALPAYAASTGDRPWTPDPRMSPMGAPHAPQHMPPQHMPPHHVPQMAPFAPKSSGGGVVALAVVGVLLLVGGVGAAALWLLTEKDPEPPPRTSTEAKSPVESKPEPTATPTASVEDAKKREADERRKLWLTSELKGHDNVIASLRKASIAESNGGFRATINNQFGFTCDLEFSDEGRPQELSKCGSREGWGANNAPDNVIKLTCEETPAEEACKGSYFLSSPQGFSSKEVMQLIRLKGAAPSTAPTSATVQPTTTPVDPLTGPGPTPRPTVTPTAPRPPINIPPPQQSPQQSSPR
jgi:serine/threonine-protein kinase